MRTALALLVIAVGAILAFAVDAHPPYFNFQAAGWIIMLTGAAGLVIPRRLRWVRRVTHRPRAMRREGPARPMGWSFRERPHPAVPPPPAPPPEEPGETVEEFFQE